LHGTNGLRVVIHDNIADKTIKKLAHSALYGTSLIFFIIGTYAIVAFVRQV
jgi:succinate dehydrogenase hydrophobic anchor subunit